MFEQQYRKRLDDDLARWETDGIVVAGTRAAVRDALGPVPRGVDLTTAVAIVGGLLIAAAFLAFVAANWEAIARPARFGILLAGIGGSFALGILFERRDRAILADLAVTVGSLVFGAAIALTGQMYHLDDDFAGGMMLWSLGALTAAILTGSRGALAVALAAGCLWSGGRAFDGDVPHVAFLPLWFAGAALAVLWNTPPARQIVAVSAVAWWAATAFALPSSIFSPRDYNVVFTLAAGGALLLGGGLALTISQRLAAVGSTFAAYGAFGFVTAVVLGVAGAPGSTASPQFGWEAIGAAVGVLLALAGAGALRRSGPALASVSLLLGLIAVAVYARPEGDAEPWLSYALALGAMLAMVVSGMLDAARPRVVAGWIGLALAIATITWVVKGSLLRRALFLAIAGGAAIALAIGLGRLTQKTEAAP